MRFVESLASRMGIMGELLMFFWERKWWWLTPMILVRHLRSKLRHSTLYLYVVLARTGSKKLFNFLRHIF